MRKIVATVVVMTGMVVAAGATPEESWQKPRFDLSGQGNLIIPTGGNDADWAGSLDFKGTYWLRPQLGAGLSLGFGSWASDEVDAQPPYELPALEDDDAEIYISTMPLGASLYFRPVVSGSVSLNLEAGVRYLLIWDEVSVAYSGETVAGDDDIAIYIEHDGDAQDGWVALLGIDVEYQFAGSAYLALGAGYQFDLTDQHYTLWGGEPRDLSFEGIGLRASLGARF